MRTLSFVLAALVVSVPLLPAAAAISAEPAASAEGGRYCIGVSNEERWQRECLGASDHCIGYWYEGPFGQYCFGVWNVVA